MPDEEVPAVTEAPEVAAPEDTALVPSAGSDGASPSPEPQGDVDLQASSPPPAATPATPPAPPTPRTLADVHRDIMEKGPAAVTGQEYAAYQQYVDTQRRDAEARRAEEERVAKLFPTKKQDVLNSIAEMVGWSNPNSVEYKALKGVVDEHFIPLETEAAKAITQPLMRSYGRDLWNALGNTQEAAQYITSLKPEEVVQAALEVGKVMGGASHIETASADEITAWRDNGKKPADKKYVPVSDVQKLIDHALDVERRATGRTAPGPSGKAQPGNGTAYTLEQIDTMSTSQWLALGDHDTRMRILDDAHRLSRR